jgi:capsular exopolysaccharide synthesis family protein
MERTVWTDFVQMVEHHMHGVEWSLNHTLALLWRRWTAIASCTLAVLALALVWLAVTPPEYTAEALLQINTRQEQVMNIEDVVGGLTPTDPAVRTEIDVIRSRKLAARVIDTLGLMGNPDFAPQPTLAGQAYHALRALVWPESPEQQKSERQARKTAAVDNFLNHLDVDMTPRSYSIQVSFTARDPELAADVVNALADAYLTSQLEDRLDTARRATAWMNDRAHQLQKQVEASELAVSKFREEHNLTEAKGITLNDQQLSELNSQLIIAKAQLAEAEAKANNSGAAQTSSEVLNSPLIQNLRVQETEVRREMSDLAARYGDRHPKMVTVRNELADVQRKIAEESAKIKSSLGNDVDVARARVRTFEDQLQDLQNQNRLSTDAAVQLNELERQADAERTLYESFLNRSKQVAQMDFAQSDARVIYPAEPPLSPSKPKKVLVILGALVFGTGLGVAIVLLLEALDSGFRTTEQLEGLGRVKVLGMLGEVPRDKSLDRGTYVTDKPTSAFTEGVRAVRTALGFAHPDKPTRVILVTSSVPQEGKSVFAASLAQVSAMGGRKTLLIDADMRRPTQAKTFGFQPKAGLAEVLAGQVTLKQALLPVKGTGMSILPSLPNAQFAQELLGSERMKAMMAELRKEFETIVIDSPPIMAVADALTLSNLADASLYMVRWGTTPRPLVLNGLRQMDATKLGVTGAVVTRVDLERQKAYGLGDYGYYYGKYKDYYSE